jgi:outer membrane protein, adhesin transport system
MSKLQKSVPQISYENVQKSSSDPSYIGSDGVTTFRISQPIFTGGLFSAQLEKAKANLQVSQAGVRETRRQIALRVVQAYADWNSADLKVKSIEKSLVIHQKLLQQAKNRIAQGASPSSDLTLVQSRIDATMGELFSAKLQSELAIQKLNELTGVTVNASQLQAGKTGPVQHKQPIESLLANAQLLSPELQRAKAQALIAKSSAQEKESALKPDIYVRAERQYGNYFSNNTNPSTRIFIGVSSKFGPGLSSFTQISAAKAQEDSSEFEIQSQQRLVRETVLNDVSVLRSLQEKMQVLEGALQASQSVLESFERQFNAGRKSWLDLMTIAKDVAQNETQLAELRGSQLQTSWRLQILTSDNYAQVNPAP